MLGLPVPEEILNAIEDEYLQKSSHKVFDTAFFNEYRRDDRETAVTLEHWLAIVERCVYVGHQRDKREYDELQTKHDEQEVDQLNSMDRKNNTSSSKTIKKNNINKNISRSRSLASNLLKDTENSLQRSTNPNGFPRAKEDNYTACDKRAHYISYASNPHPSSAAVASKRFMGAGGVGYNRTYNSAGGEVMRSRGGANPGTRPHPYPYSQKSQNYQEVYTSEETDKQLLISKANRAFKLRQANAMTLINAERSPGFGSPDRGRGPGSPPLSPHTSPRIQNWLK